MADEPLLESAAPGKSSVNASTEDHALRDQVARLVREQPYAVLCTQGGGQPYGSLVALAVTDDLSAAVFATPITTRKYRLLCDCDHVALVIDSRSRSSADMMQIEAITATGRARQIAPGAEFEQEANLLVGSASPVGAVRQVPHDRLVPRGNPPVLPRDAFSGGSAMDSDPWVIPLAEAALCDDQRIGGKAAQLARLHRAGFRIAPGFCVTVAAYEQFLRDTQLQRVIQMELGRKPFEELRWEELWDAALRIRNRFSAAELPLAVAQSICRAVRTLGSGTPLAVRSSAPGEDSAQRSFAGLHESFLFVVGEEAVLESVRLVWASLWSDAALLYRQELALDPLHEPDGRVDPGNADRGPLRRRFWP